MDKKKPGKNMQVTNVGGANTPSLVNYTDTKPSPESSCMCERAERVLLHLHLAHGHVILGRWLVGGEKKTWDY